MRYRKEKLSDEFTKYLFFFSDFHFIAHQFSGPDKGGPHDHPARFRTFILKGGYRERVYLLNADGSWTTEEIDWLPGTSHVVEAECIHEIIALPGWEEIDLKTQLPIRVHQCWTVTIPDPKIREWRFWRFSDEGVFSRVRNKRKWIKHEAATRI